MRDPGNEVAPFSDSIMGMMYPLETVMHGPSTSNQVCSCSVFLTQSFLICNFKLFEMSYPWSWYKGVRGRGVSPQGYKQQEVTRVYEAVNSLGKPAFGESEYPEV